MRFENGLKEYQKKQSYPKIPTGDETLDKLIGGGFDGEIIYLLTGDKKLTTNILWKTSVNSQIVLNDEKEEQNTFIAYVDGFNRFNPYTISKYSLTRRLNPRTVLEHILISRAFTWEQMVEILENKVSDLEQKIDVLIIAGLTQFWNYEEKFYQELWDAIRGIKKMVQKANPYIIITSSLNKYSEYKPEGGKSLQHFGQAHILIQKKETYAEYSILQHPYLKESTLKHYYPQKPKVNKREQVKNKKLDEWL
jgi:hypothetical protein